MGRLKLNKLAWLTLLGGVILGVILIIAVRMITLKSDDVHYHANFGVFVNGQQDQFKDFTFYEEVQTCDIHNADDPSGRAHMHNNVNHVVHVHAHGVTWSAFFANLGYGLTNKSLQTVKGVYVDGQDNKHLSFWLNGKPVDSVANKLIRSEDTLLVSYGTEDNNGQQKQYNSIPHDAHKYNITADPSSCSGGEKLTFTNRLKQAIGLTSH